MAWLLAGLCVFFGIHSVRLGSGALRQRWIDRLGEGPWKGLYSLIASAGLAMIVVGYGAARLEPVPLWAPPVWTRHAAALLTLPAFILLAAAYVPGNALKVRLGHPMLLGTKLWATAHLLSNGFLADVLLFGAFLLWAILDFRAVRRRPAGPAPVHRGPVRDLVVLAIGGGAWVAMAFWGHAQLVGVRPFG